MATTFVGHSSHVVVNIIMYEGDSHFFHHLGRHSTLIIRTLRPSLPSKQQTLSETYGRINLSDVQYHSSVTNKKGVQ